MNYQAIPADPTQAQPKVPVYFIGVNYPEDVTNLMYLVRGAVYRVPVSGGVTEVGGAIMVNANDVAELINKARYFDGKKLVEVLTTDATIAAAIKKAHDEGRSVPIEAKFGDNIAIAPTKDEILATMSADELIALAEKKKAEQVELDEAKNEAEEKKQARLEAKKAAAAAKLAKGNKLAVNDV